MIQWSQWSNIEVNLCEQSELDDDEGGEPIELYQVEVDLVSRRAASELEQQWVSFAR